MILMTLLAIPVNVIREIVDWQHLCFLLKEEVPGIVSHLLVYTRYVNNPVPASCKPMFTTVASMKLRQQR